MTSGERTTTAASLERDLNRPQRGLWRDAFGRLARNRVAMLSVLILLAALVMCVLTALVPAIERFGPADQQFEVVRSGPTAEHWFGTDSLGRDMWARFWEGMRNSLRIAIASQIIVVVIGIAVGAGAALGGRWTDSLLMRFTDLTYAFPDLLAIILLKAVLSEREWPVIGTGDPQLPGFSGPLLQITLAISLVAWVTIARLVRGQMLALARAEYVVAARALGAPTSRIVFQHMLPNVLGPVIVAVTFGIPLAIFAESVLGFIGFGLEPPAASMGNLINDGYELYRVNQWLILIPSFGLAVLMLCFTFLGDGLRDALDPRTRR